MKKIFITLMMGCCLMMVVGSCSLKRNNNAQHDDEELLFDNNEATTNESNRQESRTTQRQERATITEGTHKYKKTKMVSPDGETQSGGNTVFYLTFKDGGRTFYVSNHDGSRSKENGGYASRYVPGGTGIANNFAHPVDFTYDTTSGEYLVYKSKRPITHNANPDDIAGYTTDYVKMTKDKSHINVKIGDDSGYSVYYSSVSPFMTFKQGNWTVVLELVEDTPSEDFY